MASAGTKRPASEALDGADDAEFGDGRGAAAFLKRARAAAVPSASTALIVRSDAASASAASSAPASLRTSSLEAPSMVLTGHESAIYACRFSPDGSTLASCGKDMRIFLWSYGRAAEHTGTLSGHKNAVMDLAWRHDGAALYSASADHSGGVWDVETSVRLRGLRSHTGIVNSVGCLPASRVWSGGAHMVVTGGDDSSSRVWDERRKSAVMTLSEVTYAGTRNPVCAVALTADAACEYAFTAGIDGVIRQWDLRRAAVSFTVGAHTEAVTGLAVSHDGTRVASIGMDNCVRVWDVRPFSSSGEDRCLKTLFGCSNNFEQNLLRCCWSPDDERIASGSADKMAYVWDVQSGNMVYGLPGHAGVVNDVCFHPAEPVIATAGNDKRVFLGEIESASGMMDVVQPAETGGGGDTGDYDA